MSVHILFNLGKSGFYLRPDLTDNTYTNGSVTSMNVTKEQPMIVGKFTYNLRFENILAFSLPKRERIGDRADRTNTAWRHFALQSLLCGIYN